MMKTNPNRLARQISALLDVWSTVAPQKSCSGLTLEEVREELKLYFAANARVAAAHVELTAALRQREVAHAAAAKFQRRALAAIYADPSEGDDGELYSTIQARVRRSATTPTAPAPAPLALAPEISFTSAVAQTG